MYESANRLGDLPLKERNVGSSPISYANIENKYVLGDYFSNDESTFILCQIYAGMISLVDINTGHVASVKYPRSHSVLEIYSADVLSLGVNLKRAQTPERFNREHTLIEVSIEDIKPGDILNTKCSIDGENLRQLVVMDRGKYTLVSIPPSVTSIGNRWREVSASIYDATHNLQDIKKEVDTQPNFL